MDNIAQCNLSHYRNAIVRRVDRSFVLLCLRGRGGNSKGKRYAVEEGVPISSSSSKALDKSVRFAAKRNYESGMRWPKRGVDEGRGRENLPRRYYPRYKVKPQPAVCYKDSKRRCSPAKESHPLSTPSPPFSSLWRRQHWYNPNTAPREKISPLNNADCSFQQQPRLEISPANWKNTDCYPFNNNLIVR